MKALLFLVLGFASAYAADPTLKITSLPHATPDTGIRPNLMPGIAGVGIADGSFLPCFGCYGLPAGAIALPPSYYIIAPRLGTGLVFYNTVEAGNLTGTATISLAITENTTGKVVISFTGTTTLPANATNILSWDFALPDTDGYEGPETIVYTTSLGGLTTQNIARIWVVMHGGG